MNVSIRVPDLQRQAHEEHKERQERLWSGKALVKTLPEDERAEYQAEIKRLRQRNYELTFKLKSQDATKEIEEALEAAADLHLRLSDALAQLLRQAEIMSDLRGQIGKRFVKDIIADVLKEFPDVTWDELKGPGRSRHLTIPRQICMGVIKDERPDLSYPAIGRAFGGRDHTTALHSVRKIKAIMEGLKA